MPIHINGVALDIVTEWKYLGVTLASGKTLSFSARPDISSFFRASNSLIGTLTGSHEHILVSLVYFNCIPILTYCCDVKVYSARDMSDCNVAVNNVLRKIFGFSTWQSIRVLREMFGFKSIYELFKTAQDKFLLSCRSNPNPVITSLVA